MPRVPILTLTLLLTLGFPLICDLRLLADDDVVRPNYKQAAQYSRAFLGQRVYSTSVRPNWIGETDRFWFSFKTCHGTHYYLVDPAEKTKVPLFDHDLVAAALSQAVRQPVEGHQLNLTSTKISEDGKTFSFVTRKTKFDLDLETLELKNMGKAPERRSPQSRFTARRSRSGSAPARSTPTRGHRNFSPDYLSYVFIKDRNLYYVEAPDDLKPEIEKIVQRKKEEEERKKKEAEAKKAGETKDDGNEEDEKKKDDGKKEGEKKKDDGTTTEKKNDDGTTTEKKNDEEQKDGDSDEEKNDSKSDDEKKEKPFEETDERRVWANDVDESQAVQLTTDCVEDYEFSGRRSFRRRGEEEQKHDPEKKFRPSVSWAEDSSGFTITRRDSREIAELFLVNSLSDPRPTLEKYKYSMPGEEKIRKSELHVFHRARKELFRIEPKWRDEGYQNVHWKKPGGEVRFLRRDRLLRNIELVTLDLESREPRVLISEGFEAANIAPQSVRYIRDDSEMIWWSERSGWGHFYLYDADGNLKNAITSGQFRASRIVEVDEEKGLVYFTGSGREPGENIYFQHLYRVYLDGTGLTLMDPGVANHRSTLSPSREFIVDNCSRVDMAPISILRDADGKEIMKLAEADLTKLYDAGWKMPETFVVKAADGVTDLYGNMWKPFDFDPKKKYPIIADVYPGPQTEGVSHTFSATAGRQQLAQIGFIVIQVGHRGGTPGRSKAYHSYGYFNLRDYGLADKKAAIEQLAVKHPFIDIDRVGIYGHSGGGFMTAAALLRPPYNDFFKVGVASAGNHDNNVYNHSWSERYHGLKEVAVEEKKDDRGRRDRRMRRGRGGRDTERGVEEEEERRKVEWRITFDEVWEEEIVAGGWEDEYEDFMFWDDAYEIEYVDDDDEKDETDDEKKDDGKKDDGKGEKEQEKKFEIEVPTNTELAANLKGHLLLVHGDMDNNVHPAGTMRLVDALIKANKRFDMLIIPGKRHGFGDASEYFRHRMWEYFAEHLLGDRREGADILVKE